MIGLVFPEASTPIIDDVSSAGGGGAAGFLTEPGMITSTSKHSIFSKLPLNFLQGEVKETSSPSSSKNHQAPPQSSAPQHEEHHDEDQAMAPQHPTPPSAPQQTPPAAELWEQPQDVEDRLTELMKKESEVMKNGGGSTTTSMSTKTLLKNMMSPPPRPFLAAGRDGGVSRQTTANETDVKNLLAAEALGASFWRRGMQPYHHRAWAGNHTEEDVPERNFFVHRGNDTGVVDEQQEERARMMMTSLLAENGNDLGKAMTILMNQNRTTDTAESGMNLLEQDSLVKALKRAHEGLKEGVE